MIRPAAAWQCLKISVALGQPPFDEYVYGAMGLYHGLARFREAIALLARADGRNSEEAEKLGLLNIACRILDPVWAHHIGHTPTLEYVINLGILEGRRCEDTIPYEDSDAETIRAAVEEMLARLDGNASEDGEAAELRARAHLIHKSHKAISVAPLTRDFLRRHSNLIV